MNLRSFSSFLFFGLLLVACAADRKRPADASSPTTGNAPAGASQYGHPEAKADAVQGQPGQPPPPPPAPQTTSPSAQGGYAQPPPERGLALSQAGKEVDTAQRELEVAAGDCRNACRALGSMDRAAGRLCGLAQSSDEKRRCEDAKNKVYSARDRVKSTCGQCEDVTVDRNAPIPSR